MVITQSEVCVFVANAGLWVAREGPLPRAPPSRGRRDGGHRPACHTLIRSTVAWRRRSRDNWRYARLPQVIFQFCLRSIVDASWSRCVANFYIPGRGGGRQLFALPRLSHGQRPALFVALGTQQAMRLHHIVTWPGLPYSILSTLSRKRQDFGKKVIEHKVRVFSSSTAFVWNISNSKNNSAR
jgi:hypothetical protein